MSPAFLLRGLSGIPSARQLDDPRDQCGILKTTFLRRAGEFAVLLQIAVGIGLDHVDLLLRRYPKIDARVVAQAKRLERIDRDFVDLLRQLVGYIGWKNGLR